MKRILTFLLAVGMLISTVFPAQAAGDGNIDGGGGSMGQGTSDNRWSPGMDGVRVTVVNAKTHAVVTQPLDLTNKHPPSGIIHFGKICKLSYNSGTKLSPMVGGYRYYNPGQSLPRIIPSGDHQSNIDAIRSYFTDEQVIRSLAGYLDMDFDILISGKYKIVIEPIAYFHYKGQYFAMSATEAALYNQVVGGDLRRKMTSLTHKNLPLSIFLEEPDLGYPAWEGSRTQKVNDTQIISSLGIGIVRFNEQTDPPEIHAFDYTYRVDTDVITSAEISGGRSDPNEPITVTFDIGGAAYTVENVFYPEDESQLAWVKWHTPAEPCTMTITVTVDGAAPQSITANIVDLEERVPPNPVADDRNDGFTHQSLRQDPQRTEASWGVWVPQWMDSSVWVENWEQCWHTEIKSGANGSTYENKWYHWVDNGHWEEQGDWELNYHHYTAHLSASTDIYPDGMSPTATASTLKSGYGIGQDVSANVSANQSTAVTAAQNAVTFFPEFGYQDFWRVLQPQVQGLQTDLAFKPNPYSTYQRATHFTPIWYPDGSYTAYTYVMDCWTPAGMLSMGTTDTVTVQGNLWEEWHIAPEK